MASCPSCGADGATPGASCPRCGVVVQPPLAGQVPLAGEGSASLELDMPVRKAPKAAPKKKQEEELSLELAVDPRSLVQPAVQGPAASPASGPRSVKGASQSAAIVPARKGSASLAPRPHAPDSLQVGDIEFDARLLGEYGDPPRHWILSGFYAWRVLRRQREIRHALDGRREEATRSATELEDALVAMAERVKPAAEQKTTYADALAETKRAEETLRSRDAVLAAEQDAHNARLAAVETRLAKLEAELVEAQASERAIVAEIATSQGALGRAESKLKRAEGELRAAAKADNGEP